VPGLQVSAADVLHRLGRWDEAAELVEDARRQQPAGEDPLRLGELDVSRGRFGVARAYLERLQAEAAPVDQEQAGWPRVLLAEIAVWEGRYDDARALVEEGLGLTADLDAPLAAASLCAVGLRAEADRADEARILRRRQQLEQARRAGSELLDRIRELIAKPGPVDGWKREVGALAAQGEAEATRLRGGQEPDAWAAAGAAWERLGMPSIRLPTAAGGRPRRCWTAGAPRADAPTGSWAPPTPPRSRWVRRRCATASSGRGYPTRV
jgi:tetratricopeptide (TPR) repeat protein